MSRSICSLTRSRATPQRLSRRFASARLLRQGTSIGRSSSQSCMSLPQVWKSLIAASTRSVAR
ncbi:hypothetical protein [Streptosporangium vulgare]|uniref:hypothetical protein n=1 Tax=Streptosporangium vulgare TaxID=46190 RepID=UPI0031DF549F